MVYTLGESLLDIIIDSNNNIKSVPGGSMLNASVSLSRSAVDVELISELGDDVPSDIILNFLNKNAVGSYYIKRYKETKTCIALAYLDNNKKPSYTFVKNYPDKRSFENIPQFFSNDILLFGSFYSLDPAIRSFITDIVTLAKEAGAIVMYDPNIRHASHLKDNVIKQSVLENIKLADIVKGSDEDFSNIFGTSDTEKQLEQLRTLNDTALIIVTLGPNGVKCSLGDQQLKMPAIKTDIISTIGAGDAFNAGIIYALSFLKINKHRFGSYIKAILNSGLKFSSQVCNSMDNYVKER